MNVHHLELFYYVARHGGITSAVRKMPYGIQQPAVSSQLLKLEQETGSQLFHRRPFALTEAGRRLFEAIEPFFSKLPNLTEQLSGEGSHGLRLAASHTVLARFLPAVLTQLRKDFTNLRVSLEQASPARAEVMLREDQVDLALTGLYEKPAPGVQTVNLLSVPLALLVHLDSPIQKAEDLAKKLTSTFEIDTPLISLPSEEPLSQLLQRWLAKRRWKWTPRMVVSQLELIQAYVSADFGVGLIVDLPGIKAKKDTRKISLPGLGPMSVGCFYAKKPSPVMRRFLDLARIVAKRALDP